MQPPPQTLPPGAGGPPPTGGTSNMYRRNSPYNRRVNAPMAGVAAAVQPVMDPFAFGRQTPQGTPLGNPLLMHGPVSVFPLPQQFQVQANVAQGMEKSHSGQALSPVPPNAAQPGVNMFTPNITTLSPLPGSFSNSNTTATRDSEPVPKTSSENPYPNAGPALQNSIAGLSQGTAPPQIGLPSSQVITRESNVPSYMEPNPLPFPQQQNLSESHWRPAQDSRPSSDQNYFQTTEAQAPSMNYSILHPPSSQPPHQNQMHQPALQQHQNSIFPPPSSQPAHQNQMHQASAYQQHQNSILLPPSSRPPHQNVINQTPAHQQHQNTIPQPPHHNRMHQPSTHQQHQNYKQSNFMQDSSLTFTDGNNGQRNVMEKGAESRTFRTGNQQSMLFYAGPFYNHNVGMTDNWGYQSSQEHFYLQQHTPENNHLQNPVAQIEERKNASQAMGETASNHAAVDSDSGTISMFFKGDEVENEETLSSDKTNVGVSADSFQQSSFFNLQPNLQQQTATNVFFTPMNPPVDVEGIHKGADFKPNLNQMINQQDAQTSRKPTNNTDGTSSVSETQRKAGTDFENMENLELIQNQEVLPSEKQSVQSTVLYTGSDVVVSESPAVQGYLSCDTTDNLEGGPNLETPDSIPHPVRSDSVSSNYSNVSHGSASNSRRPQGLLGTFIQQETGKPVENASSSFFEQIDSPPLGGDSVEQKVGKNVYHSPLSQPPTPSPPKPTGIFQTSANSSFELVRSHGVGVKPVEVDQAKMVMELQESGSSKQGSSNLDASPGNLEQPPDNVENIFVTHAQQSSHTTEGIHENVLQNIGRPVLEIGQQLSDKRPASRTQGVRTKCESPATTLWAQNEIPNFGGNILLAPAAPPVHTSTKPTTTEIIQPPEDGPADHSLHLQAVVSQVPAPDVNVSENLENPPQFGKEQSLQAQASSGYATLLVPSPQTDSLQNQPVLLTQPLQNYTVASPVNSPVSVHNLVSQGEINRSLRDPKAGNKSSQAFDFSVSSSSALFPMMHSGSVINSTPSSLPNVNTTPTTVNSPGVILNQSTNVPPPSNQGPLNLAPEKRENVTSAPFHESFNKPSSQLSDSGKTIPDGNTSNRLGPHNHNSELINNSVIKPSDQNESFTNLEQLSFTMLYAQTNESMNNPKPTNQSLLTDASLIPQQPNSAQMYQPELQKNDKPGFYLQVTKDVQRPPSPEVAQKGTQSVQQEASVCQPQLVLPSQLQEFSLTYSVPPGNEPVQPQMLSQYPVKLSGQEPQGVGSIHQPTGYGPSEVGPHITPPQLANTNAASTDGNPSVHQDQRPPPSQTPLQMYGPSQQHGMYSYPRQPYLEYGDGRYPYPHPYPYSEPVTAHPYYQEELYRGYDSRYCEVERYPLAERDRPSRPSSRASHGSDRPPSRQGYIDDYYNQRGGRSAYEDYYADYYRNQYGDPSRWDRSGPAAYDFGYRDYRGYDPGYWYNYEREAYRREQFYRDPYANRREGFEEHWRFDPRYDNSFEDEYERRRDPYSEEFDRRSVHSEHSAHSVHSSHSRRSSFSSRSQQSQVYRSQQDLRADPYETLEQTAPLPTDYRYGQYLDNTDGQQSFHDYQYGYPAQSGWQSVEQVVAPPRPITPEKFSIVHVCVRFSPGGHLIKVLPNLPSEGQPALVELHSLETILQNTQEQEELRSFPGPLVKDETHKVDVINFAHNKAKMCLRNENLIDKESANLLWELIELLCRQNGTVVGTDIAELLLQEHKSVWLPGKSPNEANLIDFNNDAINHVEDDFSGSQLSLLTDTFITSSDEIMKYTERFRELLLFGRKKDALESAMKHGLWGHALLLASKMDSRTHARVMTRFANSLPINDPLQTVYQLMSGRMPAAATCCGDEKWGDWRPHLAMILSNLTSSSDLDIRSISTMGDTLASKGLIDAAHFCYLMAQVGLGVYTKKTTKLVLIGSNHSFSFLKFAINEAIQRTEAYEYAQSLGNQLCSLPNFQVFKFIYACRLAEAGLAAQAFHYCEVISKTVLKHPSYYSAVFVGQLIQISSKLRFFDPQLKEKPEQEWYIEPDWLLRLRQVDGQIREGAIIYSCGRATPQQYASSTPSSELDQASQSDSMGGPQELGNASENLPMSSLIPNVGQAIQGFQLMPPAPQTILDGPASPPPPPQSVPDGSVPLYSLVPPSQGQMPGILASPSHGPISGFEPIVSSSGFGIPYESEQMPMQPVLEYQPVQEPEPQSSNQASPVRQTFSRERPMDFYDRMAELAPGRRSRSTSQSSVHMGHGRRSRTTSESSIHSIEPERRNSAAMQPSPPPPAILETTTSNKAPDSKKETKDSSLKKDDRGWLSWLTGKRKKNEAHLPDDKNKSIVWDEKKKRWVNLDEPEEENKPPPPPPTNFPKVHQTLPSGPVSPPIGAPPVNVFSKKAGTRGRYVDILNPGGTKTNVSAPAPADLFAPLAPIPIPANLFVPSAVPEEQQPVEGRRAESSPSSEQTNAAANTQPQFFNPAALPSGSEVPASNTEGSQSGELSRSSSMSSLSREVSQHLNQVPSHPPPPGGLQGGTVQFYNPSQFAQPPAPTGGQRLGRLGQRKYPALK
ncbi:protein transport protein Sec16A isoform X2 [Latimeria chalumnae]|uniref:protein transport protein Sec16A isoform X2 n=1 Tax=Latimeria chalumnae TaxID=7897 RepID=UPI00313DB674